MTSHCFGFEQNITRHGDAQRQLAVELLRDATAADDAMQEVWLRARAHLAGRCEPERDARTWRGGIPRRRRHPVQVDPGSAGP